jgi:hypothetical protein
MTHGSRASKEYLHRTSDVVILFARQGIPTETMSLALAVDIDSVERICLRAKETGELSTLPPRHVPRTRDEFRLALTSELINTRAELAEAQRTIRDFRISADEPKVMFRSVAGLTSCESALLATLVRRKRASKAVLYNAVYGDVAEQDRPGPKIIDVFVCKIRRKLQEYASKTGTDPVTLGTLWGTGYTIDEANIARLHALAEIPVPPPQHLPEIESPSIAPITNEVSAAC